MSLFPRLFLSGLLALAACGSRPAFAHGDVHDRITNLTARIKLTPNNAALYLERGELHRVHREFTNAFTDFDHAQQLDPKLYMVDYCRGRTLMEAGDFQAALPPLTRYLGRMTNDANAFATRARVYVARRRKTLRAPSGLRPRAIPSSTSSAPRR
jgi:predicted Zn-dependent protease